MMNTGKIMIGFSLVLLSVAMMVSPSGATGPCDSREVGSGITLSIAEITSPTSLHPGGMDGFIADKTRKQCHVPV